MERQPDNTPWAHKLQEVTLPDAGEGWKAMAAILDKEMPAERKKRRRWLLLILLLPLAAVSGYLAWRQHGTTSTVSPPRAGNLPAKPGSSSTPAAGTVGTKEGTPRNGGAAVKRPTQVRGLVTVNDERLMAGSPTRRVPRQSEGVPRQSEGVPRQSEGELRQSEGELRQSDGALRPSEVELRRSDPGKIASLGIAGPNLRAPKIAHSNDPLKCPPVEKQKASGWVVGIGLNQSIPVDGQQVWTNPSGGLNTWWKDYIPVPFVRYYFQPKVFLQAEARIHAPQYTPKGIWFWYQYNDTSETGLLSIKKLFYFQLPVTIHFAPAPDWSVGLGLQYSHYGSGIVAQTDSGVYNNYYSFIGPLNGFPMVFVQHNEFRGLVSVDYTYRHWIIGMSYDVAFNKALSVRVPDPAAMPQASVLQSPSPFRNNSLQLFVRYILWDGRK